MKRLSLLFACALLAVATTLATQPSAASGVTYFHGTGQIVSVDEDKSGAVIKHGRIEGLMEAMTMHFEAQSATVLKDIKAGDSVRFTLKDTDEATQLVKVEKVATGQK